MEPNEKIALFRNMAEADPSNELAHFSLGRLYLEEGNLEEAEQSLRRTIELNPEHTQAHRLLGDSLLRQGKKDEAVATLSAGVKLAHRRGEYMPRNQMLNLLEAQGVAPPALEEESAATAGGETGGSGEWKCSRCLKGNPRLGEAPFTSELGEQILERICQRCWQEWMAVSIKVINEYRLDLASPQGNEIFDYYMKEFLGL